MITWELVRTQSVNDAALPDETLARIESLLIQAAEYWGQYFDPPNDVTITIELAFIDENNDVLAQAGGGFSLVGQSDIGQRLFQVDAATELSTGVDLFPNDSEIFVDINLSNLSDLYLDDDISTDEDIPAFLIDAFSVFVHEIGHGLGFTGFVETAADVANQNFDISTFGQFIEFADGQSFFTGPNAVANFGGPVPLTADDNFHLGNQGGPGAELTGPGGDILQAFAFNGVREAISSLNIAILADVGIPIRTASDTANELFGFEREADEIRGLAGDDTLSGLGGNDTLRGDLGADRLLGGAGADFLSGGGGSDIASGGDGNDQIFAGGLNSGDDVFVGGAGADVIGGGDGNDLLIGGSFDDGAVAQIGITDAMGDGIDTIFGGAGNDTLIGGGFSDRTVDNGSYNQGEALASSIEANTLFAGTGNDLVIGASGSDIVGGGTGDDTLQGGAGNDTFFGGQGDADDNGINDVITAGAGNDTVFAGGGNDSIDGGNGNDELFNGAGSDTVNGGAGNDTIFGGPGDDLFTGGAGSDTFEFFAGNGDDTVTDFSVATDLLELVGTATDFIDLASVEAAASDATQNGQAGLLIDTGGGDSVFLVGLSVGDLSSISVLF
jgi:Ca2+-binding RTX toxin-like protein